MLRCRLPLVLHLLEPIRPPPVSISAQAHLSHHHTQQPIDKARQARKPRRQIIWERRQGKRGGGGGGKGVVLVTATDLLRQEGRERSGGVWDGGAGGEGRRTTSRSSKTQPLRPLHPPTPRLPVSITAPHSHLHGEGSKPTMQTPKQNTIQ